MYYTKVQNKSVAISFSYAFKLDVRETTTCTVKAVQEGKPAKEWPTLAEVTVKRSRRDPDNKFKARNYALSRVLQALNLPRSERKGFWTAYFATVQTPWKKQAKKLVNAVAALKA